MKPEDFNSALGQESCLFEVVSGFRVDFGVVNKGRIVFRALSDGPIEHGDCTLHLIYLSMERNVLHEAVQPARVSNVGYVNPNAVVSREFGLDTATTVSLPLEAIVGAATVLVTCLTSKRMFVRRDSMRVENTDRSETIAPHSILLTVSPDAKPRFLAHARPGRHVFTSRSCLGSKGLIMTVTALDNVGYKTVDKIGLVAWLSSLNAGAVVIPRARRLERPERFNKEIMIPEETAFVSGALSTISSSAESFFDVLAVKITRFRHAVGIPTGIALFEQVALQIHETALSSSREEFLALMQGE